jgi:topoisomerase-4 subunit A
MMAKKKSYTNKKSPKKPKKTAPNEEPEIVEAEVVEPEALADGETEASLGSQETSNSFLRELMETNFIEYASYVIKERAIPDVDDGLKPVQRRILWSLFRMDDGKFHKVANAIGYTMQFHPHGDASIGDALVVLANKEYYIDKQGNFGNILTGDSASAARYIECRLTPLARETLFNNDITEFIDSYDGRNKEPVALPAKVPSLLMSGADGIAVGMATHILPHNFNELLEAQIAILQKEDFEIYPDFLQGGTMDVSEYDEGNGKVIIRAKIDIEGRKLIIREIPATTTTDSLIASIEKAADKNKIKIASINDYTGEKVEIEILPMRGYDPQKAMAALYAYTDCSVSVNVNLMVICEGKPVQMTVPEVLKRNTERLLEYLRKELELELAKLQEKFHEKTLAQIFIENRIYKRIEECETYELMLKEVRKGLQKFRKMLKRDITDEDIEKLFAIQIRRISLFDINKNKQDIDDIVQQIAQVEKHLKRLKSFAIKYLKALLEKYGKNFQRRTEIEKFDKIDRRKAALNNIKVGWDRKNGYIGTNVRSEEQVTCNEFDHLLCIEKDGSYKVINIPDKVFCGKLYDFRKYDSKAVFGVVYSDKKTGKVYAKRCSISKFITDKQYEICPKGCKLELVTPRPNSVFECKVDSKRKDKRVFELDLNETPMRSPKARGLLVSPYKLKKITFLRLIDEEEENGESEEIPQEQAPLEEAVEAPEEKATPAKKSKAKSPAEKKESSARKGKATKAEPKETKSKSGKKGKKNDPDNDGEDDDWGISQPEFGF